MLESLDITIGNNKASDFGLVVTNTGDGLFEEQFLPQVEIRETYTRGRTRPYHHGVNYKPLTLTFGLAFQDGWTDEQIRGAARWLLEPYYRETYFSESPNRRFFTIYEGDSSLIHNGLKQGHIKIQLRCNDAFAYSPERITPIYEVRSTNAEIEIYNNGDLNILPLMEIEKVGVGDVEIINVANGGKTFKLTSLLDKENVLVDNEREELTTDIPQRYVYDFHNDTFIELVRGRNLLIVNGNCNLRFKYRYKLIQG